MVAVTLLDSPRNSGGARTAGSRPQSARAQLPPRERPMSALSLTNPPAKQNHLAARVSAKLGGFQNTMANIRGTSGGGSKPVLAGFVRDLPRLRYTEIDVQALD